MRFIENNFNQIAFRMASSPAQLLYYMTVSNIEDTVLVKHILGDLVF
jgi:hypothetical protein